MTEAGQSLSVSASQSKAQAVQARDAQKMRRATELLECWKLDPSELVYGDKVGAGGQADVYLGRWQGLPVAIKKQRGSDQRKTSEAALRSITQTVRREVRALARVRHPNVVRLYGACVEQPPCLVMAYAAGGALDDAVREGRFASNNAVATLLAGVARGMEAVHAHNIIHLDLKPENVLLSADNVPWVTDFGLSTSANLTSQSTSSAGGRGTIYYKGPELFAYPPVISAAADVYAFAVLAWVVVTREQPYRNLQSAETAMGAMLMQGVRPELPDGDDWRDATTAGMAKLIEHCWQTEHEGRPSFGGAEGVVATLTTIEGRMLKKDEDATVETMLSRMWTAESEKTVTAALIDEYAAAATTAEGSEKKELEDERKGLEVTMKGVEDSSAAAQAILYEGGNGDLMKQVMMMMAEMKATLVEVRQEVRTSNVTLGSIAMNELECPRLVFITPYTPPEKRTIKTRVTDKITKAVKDRHRLIFLDPVTGTAVPCGPDGQGYVLKLPSHFLQQHGSKIRDGLIVLKLVAGLGRCAGLPLDLGGMPTEVVSMEEAQAIKMFEALLDSAASEGYNSSQSSEASTSKGAKSWLGGPSVSSESSRSTAATGKAYRALKELVEEQCNDPKLMHCGLEKCVASDGSVEWVAASSKERFQREGAKCLIWNQHSLAVSSN